MSPPSASGSDHFEGLAGVFHASPTNDDGRTSIAITEGRAELQRDASADLHHAAGAVHGSHIFKLLDDAAFFAANSVVADRFVLTTSFTVQFMSPVSGGTLTATGELVRAGRRVLFARSEVRREDGRLLATGTGTFLRSEVPLTPEIGYGRGPESQ